MIITDLKPRPRYSHYYGANDPEGECAKCGKSVYESQLILDDCYAVWWGKCPHCGAMNALDYRKGRGYDRKRIYLVLPTNEEVIMNDLPDNTPTRGWDKPENEGKSKEELIAIYG